MSTLTFIELLRGGSLTENEKTKVLEDLRTGSDAPSTIASTGNPIVTVSFTTNDNVDEDDDTTNSLRGLISVVSRSAIRKKSINNFIFSML